MALIMVWFLLTTTIGVFQLVLRELQDNRVLGNYIQAAAGAEAWAELALLSIKQKGYGYYENYAFWENSSINHILALDPTDPSKKEAEISYDMNTRVDSYEGTLDPLGYDIIPLFYLTGSSDVQVQKIGDINLSSLDSDLSELSWNIIGDTGGISGNGEFDDTTDITIKKLWWDNKIIYTDQNIGELLSDISSGYLILLNPSYTDTLTYTLSSSDFFSTPRATIISRGRVWSHRQNIRTTLDNTQYLNTLKYALYGK